MRKDGVIKFIIMRLKIFVYTACVFGLVLNFCYAQEPAPTDMEDYLDIFELAVSSSYGRIKEIYKGTSAEVIVHIQDAHANYEAQTNIGNILDLLVQDYGLRVAGIEGSVGKLETELFSTFPEDEIRAQTADYFVREGKMSGPEALVISKGFEYPLALYGIEDKELYDNNFKAFQESLPFKQEAKQYFRGLGVALGNLKSALYIPELTEIDAKQLAFDLKFINLNTYALFLSEELQKRQLETSPYPNYVKLVTAIKDEDKIDFSQAEEERTKLLTEVTGVLPEEDIQSLLDKGLAYKNGQLTASQYLSFVKELALGHNIDFSQYKNLDRYIGYTKNYDEINSFELFNEIEELDTLIRSKLYKNNEQKELDLLVRGLKVMERLVDIKMVNKDLEFYKKHQDELKTDRYLNFIKAEAEKSGVSVSLPADIAYLDVYIPAWVDFYRVAGLRDEAMIRNTLKMIKENNRKIGVMVTGGFHTRELTRMLKEKGISYIVITPLITKNIPGPYFDRLTGKKSALDKFMEELNAVVPNKTANR
ncbi:MAG: hypothetical protein KJ893_02975 [Candidatus Omnitrophica bacterium]|nr:hypothetical protein [Candidatus Omnitrophota bacterium]MBU4478065.1 hypothetical protein [Candidatus Omnitrophota bacterium]MCG2710737.1 hypothetical protein [Candidatus Omnitrophota bacterium]